VEKAINPAVDKVASFLVKPTFGVSALRKAAV
jgi:hypothetical protein